MSEKPSIVWRLGWWLVFGAAFGATEAMLVVYVRRLLGMPPGLDYAAVWTAIRPGEALTPASFSALFRSHGLLGVETAREAATLLLLLGAAMASGRSARERLGVFLYTFAVWDLSYYVWLYAAIDFPRSLTQTDVYFLIPIAWLGPVWLPVCVIMPLLLVFGATLMADPASTGRPSKRKKRRAP